MPVKKIIIIRHAEALHNVNQQYDLHDPVLSGEGRKQCQRLQDHLRKNLPVIDDAELIITSPMRRTLETTQIGLSWLIDKGVPVRPSALWQENSSKPCDTGTAISVIQNEFPELDFASVDPLYPQKTGPYAYNQDAVLQRGDEVRRSLQELSENVIVVVTHSAFLRTSVAHARFANADYRVFDLVKRSGKARLKEWGLTKERGGGMGRSVRGLQGIEDQDFRPEEVTT